MVHVYSQDKNTLHDIQAENVEMGSGKLHYAGEKKRSPKLAFQQIPMNLHPK